MFSFEDRPEDGTAATVASSDSTSSGTQAQPCPAFSLQSSQQVQDKPTQPQSTPETQKALSSMSLNDMSQDKLEQEYLRRAAEYISVLPLGVNNSAHAIKAVCVKLQNAYTPDMRTLSHNEVEKLQARYVFAVVNFVNKKAKLVTKPLTGDFVKKVLRDSNGNLLKLYTALVDDEYIALDNLEQITGLCKTILDVLPKADKNQPHKPRSSVQMLQAQAWPHQRVLPLPNQKLRLAICWMASKHGQPKRSANMVRDKAMRFWFAKYGLTTVETDSPQVLSIEPVYSRASLESNL
jgi:hypothetical protein